MNAPLTIQRLAVASSKSDQPSEERLSAALEEYAAAIERGQSFSPTELLAKYADVAEELAGCLDSLDFIRQVAPQLNDDGPLSARSGGAAIRPLATLGDFRILCEIGRGGMGVVYEAEQLSLGRRVALKVLPFAAMLDKQQLARFKNEARAAGTLDHPNIVAIYSVGVERGVHYYAMQLIEGQSLAEVIAAMKQGVREQGAGSREEPTIEHRSSDVAPQSAIRNPKSEIDTTPNAHLSTLPDFSTREYFRAVARLGIQAAEALDQAHQNGILHRDIKPANLLLESNSPSPLRGGPGRGADGSDHLKLWITDFGLARIEQDAGLTMTGDLMGTLRYMSPEQALAKRVVVDHRSDIYSLGVTLYELLTLQPAYTADDRHELLRQIAFEEPKSLRKLDRHIPAELETIILKAIEKNPADRYETAQRLADDLRAYLDDHPIKAKPPTLVSRTKKWSRRHKPLVASTIAASAAIILISFAVLARSNLAITREQGKTKIALAQAEENFEAAQAERRSAEEKAAELNAVVAFLINDVFGAATPERSLNHEITVREVLAEAETKIPAAFDGQPILEAAIRETVGRSFVKLGDHVSAEKHLLRSSELRAEYLGPDHAVTIRTKVQRILSLVDLKKEQEAQALGYETLVICERVLGPAHPTTLALIRGLGISLIREEKMTEAAAMLNRGFELARDAYDSDDVLVLKAIQGLALMAVARRDGKLSEELYQNAQLIQKSSQRHLNSSTSAVRLADVFWTLKKTEDAAMLYRDTLKMPLHPAHPDVLACRRALAALAAINGHWQEAADQMAQLWQYSMTVNEYDGGLDCLSYSPILIRISDREAYERFRHEALARFGTTSNPLNAERVCRACLLLPADEELLNQFGGLNESLLNGQKYWSANGESSFKPWGCLAIALLEYRRGNWQMSRDWCLKATPTQPNYLEAMLQLVLAMSQHQLNEHELAQTSLTRANTIIRTGHRAGQWSPVSSGWFDWEFVLILREEATQLLETR